MEMAPRWKIFPREIESDLSLYHHIDIGDWHEGRLSSRKAITLLDGLPNDSWYKLSVAMFAEEVKEETERAYGNEVRGHIWAQLHGQLMEVGPE